MKSDRITVHVSDMAVGYVSALIKTNRGMVVKKLLKVNNAQ